MHDRYLKIRLWAVDYDNTLRSSDGLRIHPDVYRVIEIGRRLHLLTNGKYGFETIIVTGRGGRDFFPIAGAPRLPQRLVEVVSCISMEMGALVWNRNGFKAALFDPGKGTVSYVPFQLPARNSPFVEDIANVALSLGIPETAIYPNLTQCVLDARDDTQAKEWETAMREGLGQVPIGERVGVIMNRNVLHIGQRGVTKRSSMVQIKFDFRVTEDDQILAMGDSWIADGPFMELAGLRVAVRNADSDLRAWVHHVTEWRGTMGALEAAAAMAMVQLTAASPDALGSNKLEIVGYRSEVAEMQLALKEASLEL